MSSSMKLLPLMAVLVGVGCSDAVSTSAPRAVEPTAANDLERSLRTPDETYVAIGTSISMGWASNGVYDGSQKTGFPALLAFGTGHSFSLPLIASPGCISPIVPPLGAAKRLNGDPITGGQVCAPNDPGVTLPTQDLGLAQALAIDAVQSTPETKAATQPWYLRVLPLGTTQLTAALAQRPTIVSVELGPNEVLGALGGLLLPGVTTVPLPYFIQPYDALLDGLSTAHPKVILFGMPEDGRHLAALRRGAEIWADRAEFAALHVDVSPDCRENQNYINVSQQSLNMVFAAAFTSTHGLPNPVYSCTDVPGTEDFILTPADVAALNTQMAQMNEHIKAQAKARGYAYATIGALYDSPVQKLLPYSIIYQLTSFAPYSPLISLDGVHPSPLGSAVLAGAAAVAYNAKYAGQGVGSHAASANVIASAPSVSLSAQLEEPQLPAAALAQAKRIVAENAGRKVSPCTMMGIGMTGC